MLEDAEHEGPQIVTRHGAEGALLLSIRDYRALTAHEPNLRESLLSGPKTDEFEVPRENEPG